jgi:hypothetical protein
LVARGVGIVVSDPGAELGQFLNDLTSGTYALLYRACCGVPTDHLVWTTRECREFAARIAGSPDQVHADGGDLAEMLSQRYRDVADA